MRVYIVKKRFSVNNHLYFEVPEGTIFIYNGKYRFEIDTTRQPPIIPLAGEKLEYIRSAANGSLLEKEISDKKIKELFMLDKERKRIEESIKGRLERLLGPKTEN